MIRKYMVITIILVFLFLLVGCKDIVDTHRPGSFGNTPEEKEMVQNLITNYGDLTSKGEPRFLELTMTSNIVNFIPVDSVSKYSKDVNEMIVWFVYDNFNNDNIEIEWKYLENDFIIHTFVSKTGENFGRGSFILEKPDESWLLGKYRVTIRGKNVEEFIDFEVIDGKTEYLLLDFLIEEPHQDKQKNLIENQINFLRYEDTNFPISLDYPSNFFLTFEKDSLVFESFDDEIYYVLSVVFDETQGGYSSIEELMNVYYEKLSIYNPTQIQDKDTLINGRNFKEFTIEYFLDEDYRNEYLVAKSEGYYYIIQFIMPSRLDKSSFIVQIKDSILINGNDELVNNDLVDNNQDIY
jgi:hypothetical protein